MQIFILLLSDYFNHRKKILKTVNVVKARRQKRKAYKQLPLMPLILLQLDTKEKEIVSAFL